MNKIMRDEPLKPVAEILPKNSRAFALYCALGFAASLGMVIVSSLHSGGATSSTPTTNTNSPAQDSQNCFTSTSTANSPAICGSEGSTVNYYNDATPDAQQQKPHHHVKLTIRPPAPRN